MSIWSELAFTEKMVSSAEAGTAWDLTRDVSKYRGGAQSEYVFRAEPRSTIRERALRQMALAARSEYPATELAERPLSPGLRTAEVQRLALRRGLDFQLSQQVLKVRAQDLAADADEKAFARLSPLQQAKRRDGWYRVSELDRAAAVAGLLRRERRQASPLTREANSRAKSIDAARGRFDYYVPTDADLENAALGVVTSLEYSAYKLTERHRRETFFAAGKVVAGGYPGPRNASKAEMLKARC